MAEYEKYCFCRCPLCGNEWRNWIELFTESTVVALDYCPTCDKYVEAHVIPLELDYRW